MQLATLTVTGNGTVFVDGDFMGYFDATSQVYWYMASPTARTGIAYAMPTLAALQAYLSDGGVGQLGPGVHQYQQVPLPPGWQAASSG